MEVRLVPLFPQRHTADALSAFAARLRAHVQNADRSRLLPRRRPRASGVQGLDRREGIRHRRVRLRERGFREADAGPQEKAERRAARSDCLRMLACLCIFRAVSHYRRVPLSATDIMLPCSSFALETYKTLCAIIMPELECARGVHGLSLHRTP